jgi:catechol 2,3-dioxygenase-like lactoylglutathione lyase family enzyme
MKITSLDHLVLTVADLDATIAFYTTLGLHEVTFNGRKALSFGNQKINLHHAGHEIKPHARLPTPGSADLCFLSATPLEQIAHHLAKNNIPIELGPIERTGATGPITSLYIRDPDGNLIELSNERQ